MLGVVLAILTKLVAILKLELRNISERITSLIFLNIYTPMQQHVLTRIISLCFFFTFLIHLLFSLSLTKIFDIFYRLHYTSLLLHLIITHLVIDFIKTMQLANVPGNYYDLDKYRE